MNMKILTALTAAVLAFAGLVSCGEDKSEKPEAPKASQTISKQDSGDCKEAYSELYNEMYSEGGGEVFYNYMYPDPVLEYIKGTGDYDRRVELYNDNVKTYLDAGNSVPTLREIVSVEPLSDLQKDYAKNFFHSLSTELYPDYQIDSITITEGYEVTGVTVDDEGTEKNEVWCMVMVEGEGWKAITASAEALGENFADYSVS